MPFMTFLILFAILVMVPLAWKRYDDAEQQRQDLIKERSDENENSIA